MEKVECVFPSGTKAEYLFEKDGNTGFSSKNTLKKQPEITVSDVNLSLNTNLSKVLSESLTIGCKNRLGTQKHMQKAATNDTLAKDILSTVDQGPYGLCFY